MTSPDTKQKPGPEAERLKIEEDPKEALRKLLNTPPPKEEPKPKKKPQGK